MAIFDSTEDRNEGGESVSSHEQRQTKYRQSGVSDMRATADSRMRVDEEGEGRPATRRLPSPSVPPIHSVVIIVVVTGVRFGRH
uniref:Uncharacterized protein n=1 Tax=Plectus sambesii TaxID=2011161 RepID=A0A914VAF5_9BILA